MKSSGLFDQWNSNSDFTGGYGIVRKQITKATGVPAGQPAGLNNYPDDWKIAANFGSIIPCNIYYCDSEGNILTESAAVQEGTFRSKVWLLIKPVSNLDYNSDYSVILEPYLPYKQLQLTVAEEPIGGGEV